MPAPKRPDPNHPLAASAAEIENDLQPTPPVPPTEPAPTPAPSATVVTPQPTPPAPVPAPNEDRMQAMFDTMMGRMDALNEENKALRARDQNREFTETRLNEQAAELARERARIAELEAQVESANATRGFTSDIVDQAQFGEIFRGMQPHLKRVNDTVQAVVAKNADLERRVAEALAKPDEVIQKFRKQLLDKTVRQSTPEFSTLLKTDKAFVAWLNEPIPGARRTRMAEVQDAWEQDDDAYFGVVVSDYKRIGNPAAVPPPADPQRSIREQQPTPPSPERTVTEDEIQAAFQKSLTGEMSRAEFKKLLEAQNAQARRAPQ